jgi:hypothetical protein
MAEEGEPSKKFGGMRVWRLVKNLKSSDQPIKH